MTVYILVHGGSQTGLIWKKLALLLEARGAQVFCPTLSDPKNSHLQNHINEICNLIVEKKLKNVTLVGHSYGGMVITGAASCMPDKINHMIFIDAIVPEEGQSLFGLIEGTGALPAQYGLDPYKPFIERIHFTAKNLKNIKKTFVLCTKSEFIHVTRAMAEKIHKTGSWGYFELETTHSPMVSVPKELLQIFDESSL